MDALRYEIVIPALAFLGVVALGSSIALLISAIRKRKAESAAWKPIVPRGRGAASGKKPPVLNILARLGNLASHSQASTSLMEQLVRAGHFGKNSPAIYTGVKLLLFAAGLAATGIVVAPLEMGISTKAMLFSLGGAVPFFLPNIIVLVQERKRRREITHHLPDAIDLLEICVSSGIGLDMAWNMVAEEIQEVSPILSSAMALTNFEVHLGASRPDAMRHMAARTGADSLSSLAAILIQTDRFGTSISAALHQFAESMRDERRFTAEENAEKTSVKMIIPMVLFIFPAIVIIVVGPAAINIARTILTR